jgi:hypothetical protein
VASPETLARRASGRRRRRTEAEQRCCDELRDSYRNLNSVLPDLKNQIATRGESYYTRISTTRVLTNLVVFPCAI